MKSLFERLVLLAATVWVAASDSSAEVLKVGDYETGDLSQFNASGTLVQSPTRAGRWASTLSLAASADKERNMRCENSTGSGGRVPGEYWYGTSLYFPADWPDVDQPTRSPAYCVSQWIKWSGDCFPFLFQIRVTPGNRFGVLYRVRTDTRGQEDIARIRKGSWNDIVVHARWSFDKTILEVYINGVKEWTYSGPMGDPCGGTSAKLEYRASLYSQHHFGPARYLVHDEYRLGDAASNYNEVLPGSKATRTADLSVQPMAVTPPPSARAVSVDGRRPASGEKAWSPVVVFPSIAPEGAVVLRIAGE